MVKVTVEMVFENHEPLTPMQKAILREMVEDAQYAIAHAVDIEETEWSLASEPISSDTCDCVVLGAGGEQWVGSMPSWD